MVQAPDPGARPGQGISLGSGFAERPRVLAGKELEIGVLDERLDGRRAKAFERVEDGDRLVLGQEAGGARRAGGPADCECNRLIARACNAAGYSPRVAFETDDYTAVQGFVAAGVGVSLIAEGFEQHIPKGYIYFAMGFSIFVEMINLRVRRKAQPVHLHHPYAE